MANKQRKLAISKKKKTQVVRGKGAYTEPTRLGSALRTLGGLGGRALGGLIGYGNGGASVGTGLGAALSKWLGSGDYDVSANSILSKLSPDGSVPAMHKNGQSITVRHKEYLTPVMSSTTFAVQNRFPLNPGLSTTFPWLSAIASQYTEYTIKGLIYHYVPTSGMAISGTNASLGSVMIQTSYRATEAQPTSKLELLNEYWSSESVPSESFCHPIECDPKENPFNVQYIRTGSLPSTENQLMYDLGVTTVATSGQQQANLQLGDLWITYEIELRKPRLTNFGEDIQQMVVTNTSNLNNLTPLGSVDTQIVVGNTTAGFSVTPTQILFNKGSQGRWLILMGYRGAAFTLTTSAPIVTNCTLVTQTNGAITERHTDTAGSGDVWLVDITDPNTAGAITPQVSAMTNATLMRVLVVRVNTGFAV